MQNGKGDTYRPVDRKVYDENWDRIFRGKEPPKPSVVERIKKLVKRKK